MAPSLLTQEGYDKLKAELEYLRSERRQEVADRLREALDGSPLGVDADVEVEAAKNAQAFVEGRIAYLKHILAQAEIVDDLSKTDVVQIGTKVTIETADKEKEKYIVVGLDKPSAVMIYDIRGKQLLTRQCMPGEAILSIDSFAPGLYLLRVDTREAIQTRKFVIKN